MKLLIASIILLSSAVWGQTMGERTVAAASEDKLLLLDQKKSSDVFIDEHKVGISFKLGYTRLTKEQNENENLLNFDIETRYAFSNKWAVYFGMGQWFNVDGTNISASGGLLAHHKNLGLTYALTGSLVRKDLRRINRITNVYKKGNKIIVKHDRTEQEGHNQMDGWRLFANLSQIEFNVIETAAYGFGGGVSYEWMHKNGHFSQVGFKYEQFNNKYVDANLGQLFISYGFLP